MGIQVTEEAKILVDGRAPRGLRERLWAWLTLWQVNRALREVKARSKLSLEERVAKERAETISICRKRQWYNGLTSVCAVVSVPIDSYAAYSHGGAWKLAYLAAAYFAYRAVRDMKTFRELCQQERELVVEEIHDR